ncbi:hypothetical protein PybrP1_000425, partial [[Pythium] brassicae (nom. inval.)]
HLPFVGPVARWHAAAAVVVTGAALVMAPSMLTRVHRLMAAETPRLVYAPSSENEALLARCEAIRVPSALVSLQWTMKLAAANEKEPEPAVAYERQLLEMPDGGAVSLDWALPLRKDGSATPLADIDRNRRTALVLPGLTGGSSEHYIRSAVHCLREKGWQVVVLNARGCGGTPLKTPQFFCIAYTDDVRFVVRHLAATYNFHSEAFVGVGFSLGSNVLVKYLGEEQAGTPLTAAVSVGNPFDVVRCSANIDATLFNRLTYGRALNTSLLELVFKKGYPGIDLDALRRAKSLYDFDDRFTRVLFKYASVHEFYTDASCVTRLPHVAVPLLCINAADDPISITIPRDEQVLANPNVILCVTRAGGHLGFFESSSSTSASSHPLSEKRGTLRTWSSRVIAEFAESVRLQRAHQFQQSPP